LFILLIFAKNLQAQDILPLNGLGAVEFSEVVKIDSLSKSAIHLKCQSWFMESYKSAKDVIQSDTEENIFGMASFDYKINNYGYVTYEPASYKISVNFDDGKYRILIYDIYEMNFNNPIEQRLKIAKISTEIGKKQNIVNHQYVKQTNIYFKNLMADLKAFMTESEDNKKAR